MFFQLIGSSIGIGIFAFLLFGILQWLHIPAGNLVDWLIGIASFWWLLVIVTVPWNVYFESKEVINEANISREKGIPFDEKKLIYVSQVTRWSIIIAIALHILSALGLYTLATTGVSAVGYISAGATLLLTGLRPVIRGYQYIAMRLRMIREQIKYPREDVIELRGRVQSLEFQIRDIHDKLNLDQSDSWASKQQKAIQNNRQELAHLQALLEQAQATNEVEHQKLSREARSAIAQITEDGQFLDHVREIIRFFKTA
jgi:hypothetical protein